MAPSVARKMLLCIISVGVSDRAAEDIPASGGS